MTANICRIVLPWADPEGVGRVSGPHPEKSQVAIGFIRNIGKDLSREAIGPWVHFILREDRRSLCGIL